MAVTITSKFYETSTPGWHDIVKIVFTSPNLDSPAVVCTRSHILPGQADLGLWYESSSNMYRIAVNQDQPAASGTQLTYIGAVEMYDGTSFDFNTDTSIFVTASSVDNISIIVGNKVD